MFPASYDFRGIKWLLFTFTHVYILIIIIIISIVTVLDVKFV